MFDVLYSKLNVLCDRLCYRVLHKKHNEIEKQLSKHSKFLAITSGSTERVPSRNQKVLLSTLEVGVVVLGCIVFFGALATAVCVICIRKKKRRWVVLNNLVWYIGTIVQLGFSLWMLIIVNKKILKSVSYFSVASWRFIHTLWKLYCIFIAPSACQPHKYIPRFSRGAPDFQTSNRIFMKLFLLRTINSLSCVQSKLLSAEFL